MEVSHLEYLQHPTPKHRDIIGGRCPDNVPLYRKVCMNGDIAECRNIAPFHLRVRLTKGLRKTSRRFTNDGQLLEGGGLMEFARQERRGIQTCQKGLNHVAGLENVLQVEVLTPHTARVRRPEYAHE